MIGATVRREPVLLIVEHESMLLRTVVGVVRELGIASVREATSVDLAGRLLASGPFDALLLALDADHEAIKLLTRLRDGALNCPTDMPTAVMADACDASLALQLKELAVRRLLLKPFKVKAVLETIVGLCAPPVATG